MTRPSAPGLLRRSLIPLAAVVLTGCGFHPMYGSRGSGATSVRRELGQIDVARVPERNGQLLRQALQQRLSEPGVALAKQYELSVSFGIAAEAIGVQVDTTTTRLRETGTATWTLKSIDPAGPVLASGTARSLDGVNVVDQQYFEVDLAQESAQRRIAESIATQITLQLATYFSKRSAPT